MASLDWAVDEGGRQQRKELSDIPAYVGETIAEQAAVNHDGTQRFVVSFATQDEANEFLSDARSYVYQLTPRLVITGNSTKSGMAKYRISVFVKPESK
jgi:hypothetical protein